MSSGVTSNQGLPEGCSLSVVGMLMLDWAFHTYLAFLNPSVHSFSYVDNLSVASHDMDALVAAFFSTIAFFELWGLNIDKAKTYFWSTNKSTRDLLSLLGMVTKQDALELGGCMTFEASKRNRLLKAKGGKLVEKWDRLRRSQCPQSQKYSMLSLVFWPAALHGAASCPVADSYIQQLRQSANKALRCNKAGSNALLRFTLAKDMTADPGFYHLLTIVQTFRRICGRTPQVLDFWKLWMGSFGGHITHGPFGVFLEMLNKIGWGVLDPPFIRDHTGMQHDLLLVSWSFLRHLLEEAWAFHVAHQVVHRATMKDLHGIDLFVSKGGNSKLTAIESSLQSSLQSGAFIDSWTQKKFDVTRNSVCTVCQVPNDHQHILVCNKFQDLRQELGLDAASLEALPQCLRSRLLCPASPWVEPLRQFFMELPDVTDCFFLEPTGNGKQHLFTDGSAFTEGRPELHQASWAVLHSGTKQVVSAGPLHGLPQTVGRAELVALISAIKWACRWVVSAHIWLDSQYVHCGFQKRRNGHTTSFSECNADLWFIVDSLLNQGGLALVDSSWIPSHLHPHLTESAFEDWVAEHNNLVDGVAVDQNVKRPQKLLDLQYHQRSWDELRMGALDKLRKYYFAIFDETHAVKQPVPVVNIEDSDDDPDDFLYSFTDFVAIPEDSNLFVQTLGFPILFAHHFMRWIIQHESDTVPVVSVSMIELTFGMLKVDPLCFPFRDPRGGGWILKDRLSLFDRPTLAYFLKIVQKVIHFFCTNWSTSKPLVQGLDRSCLGITIPQEGVLLRIQPSVLATVQQSVCLFTRPRLIRRACDLARPVA